MLRAGATAAAQPLSTGAQQPHPPAASRPCDGHHADPNQPCACLDGSSTPHAHARALPPGGHTASAHPLLLPMTQSATGKRLSYSVPSMDLGDPLPGTTGGRRLSTGVLVDEHLVSFGSLLSAATRYSRLQMLAEIPRPPPPGPGTAGGAAAAANVAGGFHILSSIEFDNRDEVFAVAGVAPRIMLYDYRVRRSGAAVAMSNLQVQAHVGRGLTADRYSLAAHSSRQCPPPNL